MVYAMLLIRLHAGTTAKLGAAPLFYSSLNCFHFIKPVFGGFDLLFLPFTAGSPVL